jgi:hypothetical protein
LDLTPSAALQLVKELPSVVFETDDTGAAAELCDKLRKTGARAFTRKRPLGRSW